MMALASQGPSQGRRKRPRGSLIPGTCELVLNLGLPTYLLYLHLKDATNDLIPEPELATTRSCRLQNRSTKCTHSHDSNSSLLLADDEDDEDGADSPDDFDGKYASHICCPTIPHGRSGSKSRHNSSEPRKAVQFSW